MILQRSNGARIVLVIKFARVAVENSSTKSLLYVPLAK